jgi:hypothetical protein
MIVGWDLLATTTLMFINKNIIALDNENKVI